jgi:hypothetical protein
MARRGELVSMATAWCCWTLRWLSSSYFVDVGKTVLRWHVEVSWSPWQRRGCWTLRWLSSSYVVDVGVVGWRGGWDERLVELTKYGILKYCVTFKLRTNHSHALNWKRMIFFFTSPSPSSPLYTISMCLTRHFYSYYKSTSISMRPPPLPLPSWCIHVTSMWYDWVQKQSNLLAKCM